MHHGSDTIQSAAFLPPPPPFFGRVGWERKISTRCSGAPSKLDMSWPQRILMFTDMTVKQHGHVAHGHEIVKCKDFMP